LSGINSKQLFSKILVGIDGSEIALKAADSAISIAKQLNISNIIAVHVLPQDIRYDYLTDRVDPDIPSPVKGAIELASLEAQEWFNKIKEKLTSDVDKKLICKPKYLSVLNL
jgi:nucleotide-binding universal stress UspA family protein